MTILATPAFQPSARAGIVILEKIRVRQIRRIMVRGAPVDGAWERWAKRPEGRFESQCNAMLRVNQFERIFQIGGRPLKRIGMSVFTPPMDFDIFSEAVAIESF